MTARLLDGRRIADDLLDSVAARVRARVAAGKQAPGLAVILVGADPASAVYVRNKRRACKHVGFLALRQRGLRPCTPKGVMTLLAHTDRPVRGRKAVVVGVSNHVGRPLILELRLAGCTTTACHKFTRDLEAEVRQADIVAVAAGRPELIKGIWIKPGAVVIDVGINRLEDGRLVG